MSIYHNVSNDTKKEYIDPDKVGGGSIKEGFIFNCGTLVTWLMCTRWRGDTVVVNRDISDHYFEVEKEYKDITLEAIEAFNTRWPKHSIKRGEVE